MALSQNDLYKAAFKNVRSWLHPPNKRTLTTMWAVLEGETLTPPQRYELSSYCWCKTLANVFNMLTTIREMTGRSIHRKKNESKSNITKKWITYNYSFYVTIYQSVLDITLHLIVEILDLGLDDRQCSPQNILVNKRVKLTDIESDLKKLITMTHEHHRLKNLLLHKGKGITVPIKTPDAPEIDISAMAQVWDMEEDKLSALLNEFHTLEKQKEIIITMESECVNLENHVGQLMTKLLPYYQKMHLFYLQ